MEGAVNVPTPVEIWLDERGTPRRLVWVGERYRVSDYPTVLPAPVNEWATHPLEGGLGAGWRFQATALTGDSRVFDVRLDSAHQRWFVVHAWQ
jgi:hypothetical protein